MTSRGRLSQPGVRFALSVPINISGMALYTGNLILNIDTQGARRVLVL